MTDLAFLVVRMQWDILCALDLVGLLPRWHEEYACLVCIDYHRGFDSVKLDCEDDAEERQLAQIRAVWGDLARRSCALTAAPVEDILNEAMHP